MPVTTTKSYFSKRASQFRIGKITLDDNNDCEIEKDDYEPQTTDTECERERTVIKIVEAVECQPDLQKDKWVAVAYETNWFYGHFIHSNKAKTQEVKIHFLQHVNHGLFGQSFQVMEMKIKRRLKKVTILLDVYSIYFCLI